MRRRSYKPGWRRLSFRLALGAGVAESGYLTTRDLDATVRRPGAVGQPGAGARDAGERRDRRGLRTDRRQRRRNGNRRRRRQRAAHPGLHRHRQHDHLAHPHRQFLHQDAHALLLDATRISHLWAKELPTVTHRGNRRHPRRPGRPRHRAEAPHQPRRRATPDGRLRPDRRHPCRYLARYWETFRQEGDPEKSPAITALEDVCTQDARPSTSSTTVGSPTAVSSLPPASSSPPCSSCGSAPTPSRGSPR